METVMFQKLITPIAIEETKGIDFEATTFAISIPTPIARNAVPPITIQLWMNPRFIRPSNVSPRFSFLARK